MLKLSRLEEDTRDIHQYLLQALDRCQQEQEEVLGWLEQQELEEKRASEAHELQLSLERQEMQRNVDTVTSEIVQQGKTKDEERYASTSLMRTLQTCFPTGSFSAGAADPADGGADSAGEGGTLGCFTGAT